MSLLFGAQLRRLAATTARTTGGVNSHAATRALMSSRQQALHTSSALKTNMHLLAQRPTVLSRLMRLGVRYESSSAAATRIANSLASMSNRAQRANAKNAENNASSVDPEAISEERALTRFDQVTTLDPRLRRAIQTEFGFETMSPVQSLVMSQLPLQTDLLVRAETGSGKTLAFLLPAINEALQKQTREDIRKGKNCKVLVISPTRELALQIAEEASKLCWPLRIQVRCFVGGESRRNNVRDIQSRRIDVLVATPGRLEDLLDSEAALREQLQNLTVLTLDEADTLLEMGFRDSLTNIIDKLPKTRRTFLFSATLSSEVRNVARIAFCQDHKFIDAIGHDSRPRVPEQIKQSLIIAPFEEQPDVLRRLLSWHLRGEGRLDDDKTGPVKTSMPKAEARGRRGRGPSHSDKFDHPGKVVVFFPTTKATMLYSSLFRAAGFRDIYEIHSKRDQKQRARVAERFRNATGPAILFTSDVSARGVDYPGVTLVVQMGIPSAPDQYVHRAGRTGRAGNSGRAITIYSPMERAYASLLADVGLRHDSELENRLEQIAAEVKLDPTHPQSKEGLSDNAKSTALVSTLSETDLRRERMAERNLEDAKRELDPELIKDAYSAFLGFYISNVRELRLRNRNSIIDEADNFAKGFGLTEPLHVSKQFLARIGFDVDGSRSRDRSRDRRSSSRDRYGRDDRDGGFRRSYGDRGSRGGRDGGSRRSYESRRY
jgi:ATP-dependent RNA helicase MSS116